MILKKTNSAASLAAILSAFGHIGVMSWSLWTGWYDYNICKGFARTTAALFILHILLSIIIFFFKQDPSDMKYGRLNKGTIIQRITAIVMIILIHFHTSAYSHVVTGEVLSAGMTALRIITEILFFGAVLWHIGVSCPKAFITLGIARSEKGIKVIGVISCIICGLLFLAAGGGAVSFYLKGIM